MTEHRKTPHHIQARPLSALDAIFMRRSVRAYTTQKLDEATIRSLLDAAVQAPTAMHMEPWVFAVIQDEATLKRYSKRAKGNWAKEAARWGTWAAVRRSAEAVRQGCAARLVSQLRGLRRYVVQQPMRESPVRCIGVVHDEGEAAGALRRVLAYAPDVCSGWQRVMRTGRGCC